MVAFYFNSCPESKLNETVAHFYNKNISKTAPPCEASSRTCSHFFNSKFWSISVAAKASGITFQALRRNAHVLCSVDARSCQCLHSRSAEVHMNIDSVAFKRQNNKKMLTLTRRI